jgi:Aldo/keto reductase family
VKISAGVPASRSLNGSSTVLSSSAAISSRRIWPEVDHCGVQAQPGVTSTIIGARRLAQLEDNLKALEVKLSVEELGGLDALTKPTFGFPQSMQPWFSAIHNGGTSVNGISAPPSPFGVEKGDKIY